MSVDGKPKELRALDGASAAGFSFSAGAPNENPPDDIFPPILDFDRSGEEADVAPPGFSVSQQGHFEYLGPLVTAQLGHFQLPGSECIKRASGLTSSVVFSKPSLDVVGLLDFTVSLGLSASQHGHFEYFGPFVTEQLGHFQLPASTCINRANGFTSTLDADLTRDVAGGSIVDLVAIFVVDASFIFTDETNESTFGDAGINENGASTPLLWGRLRVAFFGGSC